MREAASGSECLEILQQEHADAVLLDINMDDLNGWQTAQRIRSDVAAALPIVFVSADPFENRPELLAAVGCQGFVSKPVIESELLDLLARVLQLEWVHESDLLPTPANAPAPAPAPRQLPLPDELRASLISMARLGNASGLRYLLRATTEQEPALADTLQSLSVHVDRFDFSSFIECLKIAEDESDH